jgi:hypothetical protein
MRVRVYIYEDSGEIKASTEAADVDFIFDEVDNPRAKQGEELLAELETIALDHAITTAKSIPVTITLEITASVINDSEG